MGGPSLLGAMSDDEIAAYLDGQGWQPTVTRVWAGDIDDHQTFHRALMDSVDATFGGERRVVVLRCVKGWSGPIGAHKTPLTDLRGDPRQRLSLHRWMSSYRPGELFDEDAQPIGRLAAALDHVRFPGPTLCTLRTPDAVGPQGKGFGAEVTAVLRTHAAAFDFKVFSPDEIRSNRLPEVQGEPWTHEALAEEVLFGWLAGWTASGRRGVMISYEAFAPLLLTGIVGQLKQRRLAGRELPSINLLLTSYGWHNVHTHGDPSLTTALLGLGDPAVHVFTPADADRAALALDDALRSSGRVNVIVAGKHALPAHPHETWDEERRMGLAVWDHVSDRGEPDLTLVCAGDLAASVVSSAATAIRDGLRVRVRVVNVHELGALANEDLHRYVGHKAAVLIITIGHPAAIWGLVRGRLRCVDVVGWREPPHPMPQDRLASHAGLDVAGVAKAATTLMARRSR
jgi:xylulose-5-phosphate/fructose-6-phosphate phosphoketolase